MNLQDLLRDVVRRRQAQGLPTSTRAIADEIGEEERARGMQLNHTTVANILNGTHAGRVGDGTIRAIAWLADVSEETAFAAAGKPLPGPPFEKELPPGVDDLTPADRRAAVAILRQLVAQRHEINRLQDSLRPSHRSKPGALLPGGIPGERIRERRTEQAN